MRLARDIYGSLPANARELVLAVGSDEELNTLYCLA